MRTTATRRTVPSAFGTAEVVDAGRLFGEYAAYVAAFLRRLGIRDTSIDDAVQEVFLVAHTRGGYQPGPASARTWLGAIAIRVAANARRAHSRRRETADEHLLENHATSPAPDVVVEQRQLLAQVEGALNEMSTRLRQTFLLAVAGHSQDDIARSLEVPTGTVHSRLHAARNSLDASLEIAA